MEPGAMKVTMRYGEGGTLVWSLSGAVFTAAGMKGLWKESGNQVSRLPGRLCPAPVAER